VEFGLGFLVYFLPEDVRRLGARVVSGKRKGFVAAHLVALGLKPGSSQ